MERLIFQLKTDLNLEGPLFNQENILKIKRIVRELGKIRGRHTELVSVYIPAGYNIQEIINQLFQEKGTAENIKSKATRKNVISALDKIIQHLKLIKKLPENGLVVFAGNISLVEGRDNIQLWSFEPPEKMAQKVYWCDQEFVLEPLKEMMAEKEVYGLIVLDAREASVGILRGRQMEKLKHLESAVPSKTVKGGMCVDESTLIQVEDGNIIPIKELLPGKKILAYSFKNFKNIFTDSFEIFKRKAKKSYKLDFKEPSNSLILTPEHLVFTVGSNGVEEKTVDEIKPGDMLLSISKLKTKNRDDGEIDKWLAQFLGYFTGGGTVDSNRIILYDKDIQLLTFYQRVLKKIINKKPTILKRRNSYELRLYRKPFVDYIKSVFPKLSTPRKNKDIDQLILTLSKEKLRYFLRGLFDAEAYVNSGIGLRMANESIIRKIRLLLLRFDIVAGVRGPDKFDRYELRIANPIYIKNFEKEIGLSSKTKMKRLLSIRKRYKSGRTSRVPISGLLVRKIIEKESYEKGNFKTYGMFLLGKRNVGYPNFNRFLKEFKKKFKNQRTIKLFEKLSNSGLIAVTVKEKSEFQSNKSFYDIYVPGINSFVANGIVVHNSQGRYDRIREDAINEFLTKVGEVASEILLKQENLKGLIIGGPGPVKDRFVRDQYLHYQLQKKILGVKDIGYTGEYGLEELIEKAKDLLKEATIQKERELMEKFFKELQNDGNVVYGYDETIKALDTGAVETLLLSEGFDWIHVHLRCDNGHEERKHLSKRIADQQICDKCGKGMTVVDEKELIDEIADRATQLGAKVEYISVDTREGVQFKELSGIGAFLRYKI